MASSGGGAGEIIVDAIGRTAAVSSYRIELALDGDLGTGGRGSLLAMEGAFVGADYEYSAMGLLPGFVGADPTRGLQVIRVDDVSYVRGPFIVIGATADVWYRVPAQQAALVAPLVNVAATLNLLADSEASFDGYQPGATMQRDGLTCVPYRGDREATLGLLGALASSGLPGTANPEQVEDAESTLLICDDDLLHGLDLEFSGKNPGDPPMAFSYTLAATLSQLGADLTVAAPAEFRDIPTVPGTPRP